MPGPDLRTHDVHGGDAQRFRVGRELEVESGIVDRHHDIGPPRANHALHCLCDTQEVEKLLEHGPEPHHRQISGLETFGLVSSKEDL